METTKLEGYRLTISQNIMGLFKEKYKGLNNAAKTDSILFHLKATGQASITPQTFRDLIGYIRKNDLLAPYFIVSNVNTGYWLSNDKKEIDTYINQELNRMSNQFGNIQAVHQRTRDNKKGTKEVPKSQSSLF